MTDRAAARAGGDLLREAVRARVFPAAVAEVGDSRTVLWSEAFGTLTFEPNAPLAEPSTIFDLASLTKPIATTSLVLGLMARRAVCLDDLVAAAFVEWRGQDRAAVTVQDLLEHAGGLAARFVDKPPTGRREFEHEICTMPLEYVPRSMSVYSDLGFILLGFLVEDRGGGPLAKQFEALVRALSLPAFLGFAVPVEARGQTAPTLPLDDDLRRGRTLVGEVQDSYAAVLGGAAGHAGLFGTAEAVGRFAREVLRGARGESSQPAPLTPLLIGQATTKTHVAGSSRALGWDTMLPSSSCGTAMSQAAFGHVGFTGTSLWIDPLKDRYFVLLTNRACGGGTLDQMRQVRRTFHDTLASLRA